MLPKTLVWNKWTKLCQQNALCRICTSRVHPFLYWSFSFNLSPVYMSRLHRSVPLLKDYRFKVYKMCTFECLSHLAVPDSRQSIGPASQWRAAGRRRLRTAHKRVGGSGSFGSMPAATRSPRLHLCSHIDVAGAHALHTHAYTWALLLFRNIQNFINFNT